MGPLGAPSAGSTLSSFSEGAAGPAHRQGGKGSPDSVTPQWVEQNQVCTSGSWDPPCSPPSSAERHPSSSPSSPPSACSSSITSPFFPFPALSPLPPPPLPPSPRLVGSFSLLIVSCSSFLSPALSGLNVQASVCSRPLSMAMWGCTGAGLAEGQYGHGCVVFFATGCVSTCV